jgi:hypothetical protein
MTKITADQLARQRRAAFVSATHALRGKSGKESPGDKSFIRAKGIRLTKSASARIPTWPTPANETSPACSVTRFLWSNACPPRLAEASQFITFVGAQRHGLGVPPTCGGHQSSAGQRKQRTRPSDEDCQEEAVGGVAGDCKGTIVTGILAKL